MQKSTAAKLVALSVVTTLVTIWAIHSIDALKPVSESLGLQS